MGPGGHHGPRGGFQKPKNTRATLAKLMAYLGCYKALLAVVMVLLFFVCTAYLVDATYNPFLYFRF